MCVYIPFPAVLDVFGCAARGAVAYGSQHILLVPSLQLEDSFGCGCFGIRIANGRSNGQVHWQDQKSGGACEDPHGAVSAWETTEIAT